MSEIADAKMIQELKEAALAATPGPWDNFGGYCVFDSKAAYEICETSDRENCDYIALANPAAILALIAKVERLEKDYEELNFILRNFKRITNYLANEIDENDQEVESEVASLEGQLDYLAKTCAALSLDASDATAVNWWRSKAREAVAAQEVKDTRAQNHDVPGK